MVTIRGHKPPVGEPVLDRAVRLLDAFDGSGRGLPLAVLARRSGLAPSTALRLARQLTDLGLLERSGDGDFTIGIRMLELASRAPRGHGVRSTALPYMEELHRATGHHVLLGVRDGDLCVGQRSDFVNAKCTRQIRNERGSNRISGAASGFARCRSPGRLVAAWVQCQPSPERTDFSAAGH